MLKFNDKKGIIIVSVIAFLLVTAVILYLSLSDYGKDENLSESSDAVIDSASLPGQNNKEVKSEESPRKIEGTYEEAHDGWYYDLLYTSSDGAHGTYSAGYNQGHSSVASNPEKDYTEQGNWSFENGEIKLYTNNEYRKSLWFCGDYLVDSQNYFVGKVPDDDEAFQSSFISKAALSGDTQILNFYSDGKMIMEIIRDDGELDSDADSSATSDANSNKLPPYQAFAGKYTIDGDKLEVVFPDESKKIFYLVDDGIAGWVYNRKQTVVD